VAELLTWAPQLEAARQKAELAQQEEQVWLLLLQILWLLPSLQRSAPSFERKHSLKAERLAQQARQSLRVEQ
jgi:hypothetical protein